MHRPARTRILVAVLALPLLLVALGCGDKGAGDAGAAPFDKAVAAEVQEGYAGLLLANYQDVHALTSEMKKAIDAFLAAPSEAGLAEAKKRWTFARLYYQQSEMARFYGGPIDDEDGPEGLMNAWPLEEGYIDYVEGGKTTPLIADAKALPEITPAALEALNESSQGPDPDPERNIATGWHAIEFLLWGQDLTEPGQGPGTRSYKDYVDGGGTAPNGNEARRRQYLAAATDLLLQHLQTLIDDWAPGGAYRKEWNGLSVEDALTRILIGVGTLAFGELRGERLVAARLAADQEEEHSCFSDTTHFDHLHDIVGLQNVWTGIYASGGGKHDAKVTGLEALAKTVEGEHAAAVADALAACRKTSEAPGVTPFEVAITAGSNSDRAKALVAREVALSEFADALAALAKAMGLKGVTNDQI